MKLRERGYYEAHLKTMNARARASNVNDAQKLIEQGFDVVTDVDGVKLFRKRK